MTKRKHYQDPGQLWKDFGQESTPQENDRTTAIVGAAFLEAHLEQLITSFLIDDKSQTDKLLGIERPLGSFGVKIRAAYCLGLISKNEYHDLRIIQKVRNAFAHELAISFTDEGIRDRCNTLELP